MANIENYTQLVAWQESRKLVNMIYTLSLNFPAHERYGLTSQIRRAATSILSNLSEGCGRGTTKDTIHFLHIARGSAFELESHLYIALDQGYLDEDLFNQAYEKITLCKKLLNGFIRYLHSRSNGR